MKLIRKWNPESAPYIPHSIKVYRMVALVKDDTYTHYACFYDKWSKKIYMERIEKKHAGNFSYSDCVGIDSDEEWNDLLKFLSNDECQVIQTVETKITEDTKVFNETGEITFHENMSRIPHCEYGVDDHGSRLIDANTPVEVYKSPNELEDNGQLPAEGKIIH